MGLEDKRYPPEDLSPLVWIFTHCMTQEISFISAGEDEKEAISFLLKFVEEKFLELGSSPQNKINLRCNDAAQANELDQKLWEDLNEVF